MPRPIGNCWNLAMQHTPSSTTGTASCVGSIARSPTVGSKASTASFRPPRQRRAAIAQPGTSSPWSIHSPESLISGCQSELVATHTNQRRTEKGVDIGFRRRDACVYRRRSIIRAPGITTNPTMTVVCEWSRARPCCAFFATWCVGSVSQSDTPRRPARSAGARTTACSYGFRAWMRAGPRGFSTLDSPRGAPRVAAAPNMRNVTVVRSFS